jgi:glycosyltransferase involved in cell wall biosynthesis
MNLLQSAEKPLLALSVLVSSFNKRDFLEQSSGFLEEIAQLGAQVVIVEDTSTDGSLEIIESWSAVLNGLIRLVIQENSGSAQSRNKSISMAEREYLLFIDIDDDVDVEVLVKLFPKIVATSADLALAGYTQVPANRVGPYPLKGYSESVTVTNGHRTELFEGMGWWRYFYKHQTLSQYEMHFVPTFKEMGDNIFVLDDLFWLLHLFSMDLKIYRASDSEILYRYYLPDQSSISRREWYLNQVELMPRAMKVFLQDLNSHPCEHDNKWLLETCQTSLWQHANFLDVRRFLQNAPRFLSASFIIDVKRRDFLFSRSVKLFGRTALRFTFYSLKSIFNS